VGKVFVIKPGLPDGKVSYQNYQTGYIWEVHGMENIGIFNVPLEYFNAIFYILWPFGVFVSIWNIFPRFGILYQEKSGNPASSGDDKIFLIDIGNCGTLYSNADSSLVLTKNLSYYFFLISYKFPKDTFPNGTKTTFFRKSNFRTNKCSKV
jgi:hypothetical protein